MQWGKGDAGYTHTYPLIYSEIPCVLSTSINSLGSVGSINLSDVQINQFKSHCLNAGAYYNDKFNWVSIGY